MIELELELVAEGRLAEFRQLNDDRDAVMAELLETPPAWAMPTLRRAELIHQRLAIELERQREAIVRAVSEIERARRAAHGYQQAGHRRPRFSSSA